MTSCANTSGPKFTEETTNNCSLTQNKTCSPFQLSKSRDSAYIDSLTNEALNIGGADIHVYKLLGVHEQTKLIDVTGNGSPISGGYWPDYPVLNAFDVYQTEWRSIQKGDGVIASAYIGYDFGLIKANDDSRPMYSSDDASIRKHITAIAIKQSSNSNNRVTKIRVERSDDGVKWYGVSLVPLTDDDCLNTILFKHSVPNRFWRLRPVEFNGAESDYWGIQALQMYHDYVATDESNIQDKVFLENRDRDYADEYLTLKGSYDLSDVQLDLDRYGYSPLAQQVYLTVNFNICVNILNRPLIVGDIIELPSEAQWSADMKKVLKWLEVTDVAWSTEGYTPGWTPTLLRLILKPAFASQETQDIFGDLAEEQLPDGLVNTPEDKFQDYSDVSQTIQSNAKDAVPMSGAEGSSAIREWEDNEIAVAQEANVNILPVGLNSDGLYVEDAMPPNNQPFTEGPEYPESPSHGDYHRLTYEGLSSDVPARLYRYSETKGRWIFLESDKRTEYNDIKPKLQEFLTSAYKTSNSNITKG